MKIVQIIDSLNAGGAERMCINIGNLFSYHNLDNEIICTRERGLLSLKYGKRVIEISKKSSFDIFSFFRLNKTIKSLGVTHIHAHSTSIYWSCLLKFFNSSIILIWHDHYGNSEFLEHRSRFGNLILSLFTDKIIVVNDKLLQWQRKNTFLKNTNIQYLENFPSLSSKFNYSVNKSIFDEFKIVQVANFRTQKNHFLALEVVKRLKEFQYPFKWRFVGTVVDTIYYAKILTLIEKENLNTVVEIFENSCEIEEHLKWANCGVLTSNSEGLPVSLLEYGLAELPVVVTDVGQCFEVVENGKCGYLIKSEDTDNFAQTLFQIMEDYSSNLELGKSLQRKVEVEYGSLKFFKKYLEIINSSNG
jgi:glycosyltransferase involved in cell wall biosynthesis